MVYKGEKHCMPLTLAKKPSPDNTCKQKRDSEHNSSKCPQTVLNTLPASVVQREPNCPCGGGCPRCKAETSIQTKLKINKQNDKYEQEADRMAEQVLRMPENTAVGGKPTVVRKEDVPIQRKPT